jgi:hypothetical protein
MGTFFKECERLRSRWSKCPHLYGVRYRDAAGKQVEESGFVTQDDAIRRLTDVYNAKRAAPASVRHLDSLLEHPLLPVPGSRRMGAFDHKVVDGFIRTVERNGAGLATRSNAFDELKAILLDAHRLGIFDDNRWRASSRPSTTRGARSSPPSPSCARYAPPATTPSRCSPTS